MNTTPSIPVPPPRARRKRDYLHLKPQVIAALKAGMSVGATHRELGVPESAITAWRNEAGIPAKKPGDWKHPRHTAA